MARAGGGLVVFVRGAAPRETVRARIRSRSSGHANAELVEVLDPSPHRVDAPCPYFGVCGGCDWQHVSYEEQLRQKRMLLHDALARIGGLSGPVVADPVPSPPYGYRNKIELRTTIRDHGLMLGYTVPRGSGLLEIETCDLLPSASRDAPARLRGALRYLSGASDLAVERVALRVAAHTRDVAVDLRGAPAGFPRQAAGRTLVDAVGARSVTRTLMPPDGAPRPRGVEVLAGRGFWKERLAGFTFRVSPPSFFQVNTKAAEALVTAVLERAAVSEGVRVLDAFAGVGTLTLPLAATGATVTAAESSKYALGDLERDLRAAGLRARVLPGPFERTVANVGEVDVVVLDPPRAGLAPETPAALASTGARRIVYVSCHPATAARDVARLSGSGFRLRDALPVDLFPQTHHLEAVLVLER